MSATYQHTTDTAAGIMNATQALQNWVRDNHSFITESGAEDAGEYFRASLEQTGEDATFCDDMEWAMGEVRRMYAEIREDEDDA